jgi:hypothetical protein
MLKNNAETRSQGHFKQHEEEIRLIQKHWELVAPAQRPANPLNTIVRPSRYFKPLLFLQHTSLMISSASPLQI